MVTVRSTFFLLLVSLWTIPFGILVTLAVLLPIGARYRIIALWRAGFMALCRVLLGIRYRVIGRENIPSEPCVVLAKHQSAWETVGLQEVFPP
ncbi:MAG: 1-acyl-sn-glycerol-3-phosphate acyltransferase, partial [Candidatus Accumulibacter sp.]|nr:1-acyl-sn-glycerol-3-phosphate acyltransferase [Accumulibacter sp.]